MVNEIVCLSVRQLPQDFARNANDERSRRHILGHNGSSANNAACANLHAIQDYSANTD
jgi:hypothetical protein